MKVTLQELFEQFINEQTHSAKLRPKTITNYRTTFNLFIILMPEATIDFTKITKDEIVKFFERIDKRSRIVGLNTKKTGVKASTINTHRAKLGKFFEWLRNNSYIKKNPVYETAAPREIGTSR